MQFFVAVSSSGNSQNIVQAIATAQRKGMKIITFTGFEKENQIRSKGTYNVCVPVKHYGITESVHHLLLQQIVDAMMEQDKSDADRDDRAYKERIRKCTTKESQL